MLFPPSLFSYVLLEKHMYRAWMFKFMKAGARTKVKSYERKRPRMSNPKMSNPRMSNPKMSNAKMSKGVLIRTN